MFRMLTKNVQLGKQNDVFLFLIIFSEIFFKQDEQCLDVQYMYMYDEGV